MWPILIQHGLGLGGLVWCEQGLTDQATEQELERGLSANACCILVTRGCTS